MTKKGLVALGVAAAIIIALVFYFFFSGAPRFKGLEKPRKPEVKSQTTPKPKPGPTTAPAPTPAPTPTPPPAPAPPPPPATQAPAPPLPGPGVAPPEKPVTRPETPPPPPSKTVLEPLKPQEGYGLLVGRYRKYGSAGKKMEKLKKKGLPAFIRRDKGRYQVWVGPFASRQEARKAAKALKGKKRRAPAIHKLQIPVPK